MRVWMQCREILKVNEGLGALQCLYMICFSKKITCLLGYSLLRLTSD